MKTKPGEYKDLFIRTGGLLAGHFKLSSGRHSDQYFQCALPLSDPKVAERLGKELGRLVDENWPGARAVVSPALGGVIIGHETARALGVRALFSERQDGKMTLRRGFYVDRGMPVIVVEDVITTGKSTGEVVELLRGLGARVLGAASIVLRAEKAPELGVPFVSLAHLPAKSWEETACPLCKEGKPIMKPGSRPG
jgi:orotate phosphoribosyltransferase